MKLKQPIQVALPTLIEMLVAEYETAMFLSELVYADLEEEKEVYEHMTQLKYVHRFISFNLTMRYTCGKDLYNESVDYVVPYESLYNYTPAEFEETVTKEIKRAYDELLGR